MERLFASWFGTGLIVRRFTGSDSGSGTVGSLFAFPLAVWIGSFGLAAQIISVLVVVALANWSVARFVETEGDAGWIVIDEAAGTFLATVWFTWLPALVALVVFRVADIFKKVFPGVEYADQQGGARGVVIDDLVAGVYGLVAGWAAATWIF